MIRLWALLTLLFAIFSFSLPTHAKKAGTHNPVGSCKQRFATFSTIDGHGAFAVSRSGKQCGWSRKNDTKKAARLSAVRACSKAGKRCRVIKYSHVGGGVIGKATPWVPRLGCVSRLSKWNYRFGKGAFAVTKKGVSCGWSTNQNTTKEAIKKALRSCRKYGVCKIIKTK